MLSDAILLSIICSTVGVLSLLIRFCYISKCTTVNICCGMLKINRDVAEEHNKNNNDEIKNNQNENV